MCGIIAYVGERDAFPIIHKGILRLEYRGYDSSGIGLLNSNGDLNVYKRKGKYKELEILMRSKDLSGNIGMGHIRWATHGEVVDKNAHPHLSNDGKIAVIHNGIIENYHSLRTELIKRGFHFESDTDTEVLSNLFSDVQNKTNLPIEECVRIGLKEVVGAYAIVVMSKAEPNKLVAAKLSSSMLVGYGDNEYFIASDPAPLIENTRKVTYLEDNQMVILERGAELVIKSTTDNTPYTPYVEELKHNLDDLEKDGFDHFMLKEIFEQPRALYDSIRGRTDFDNFKITLGGVKEYENAFKQAKRLIFVACGTSWHASMIGEYLIEDLARIPVEVEYASEFRYRNPIIGEGDIVIAISQSGETADTKAALELAKEKGALIYGINNVVGSSIARMTHAGSYTHAGQEIGIASTKAFTAQLSILSIMALQLADLRGTISKTKFNEYISELNTLPSKIESILKQNDYIKSIAENFIDSQNFLYLGRGYNFPIALEGALKLKEISYIHAEGYPSAEIKHGPIALIDEKMPVVVVAPKVSYYQKTVSNIEEVKARKARVISVISESDDVLEKLSDYVIRIPETTEALTPILSVIPLQIFAYHLALLRGSNVDSPRNLSKSVTVE